MRRYTSDDDEKYFSDDFDTTRDEILTHSSSFNKSFGKDTSEYMSSQNIDSPCYDFLSDFINVFKPQIVKINKLIDKNKKYYDSLVLFSGAGHTEIRDILSNRVEYPDEFTQICMKAIDDLYTIFENIPPTTQEIIAYRGITADSSSDIITDDPSFSSFSLNKLYSIKFIEDIQAYSYYEIINKHYKIRQSVVLDSDKNRFCCLMRVIIPPGAKIIPLFYYSSHCEYEILLPPHTNLEYIMDDVVYVTLPLENYDDENYTVQYDQINYKATTPEQFNTKQSGCTLQ